MANASNVVRLPPRPAVLLTVRSAINARAAAIQCNERLRLRAQGAALGVLCNGASTGWAIQTGLRVLRGVPQVPR